MQIVVVGAGPTGLFLGMTLARRGHGSPSSTATRATA